ncbi:MAG: hypothetical protein SGPRY_006717 [Prymnesium sp.]
MQRCAGTDELFATGRHHCALGNNGERYGNLDGCVDIKAGRQGRGLLKLLGETAGGETGGLNR